MSMLCPCSVESTLIDIYLRLVDHAGAHNAAHFDEENLDRTTKL
jgi:hypothetical protein